MRTLQVDVEGLDLVLGGGFALLERVAGAGESATILIRGPAGSGKTALGTQFAASIARSLGSDVAYGCVELLPAELRAQHESIRAKSAKEKVIFLNEDGASDPGTDIIRIYTGLLDLGDEGSAAVRLGSAVDALLSAARERANRDVRVLVIDSLSEGYGIGAGAPRILADGVSKFAAERGLVIILLEEQSHEGSSVWGFAVDSVFELRPAEDLKSFERRLLVSKNRLGPSDPGPHEFLIRSHEGVRIHPRVATYQRSWLNEVVSTQSVPVLSKHSWCLGKRPQQDWLPSFRSVATAVVGSDLVAVRRVAMLLGSTPFESTQSEPDVFGPEIFLTLGISPSPIGRSASEVKSKSRKYAWDASISGASLMAFVRRELERQAKKGKVPLRVVIGDLRSAGYHVNPKEALQAVSVIAALLRAMKVPLVLYETSDASHASTLAAVNADMICECLGRSQQANGQGDKPHQRELVAVRLSDSWRSENLRLVL